MLSLAQACNSDNNLIDLNSSSLISTIKRCFYSALAALPEGTQANRNASSSSQSYHAKSRNHSFWSYIFSAYGKEELSKVTCVSPKRVEHLQSFTLLKK